MSVLAEKTSFSGLSPKYFESGSLFRIFHVYTFFTGNQFFLEKSWIYRPKCRPKHGYTGSIECFPLIHVTFSTVFSTVNPRYLQEELVSSKKSVYMKNAEGRVGFEIFWRNPWK